MKAFITMLVAAAALGLGACASEGAYGSANGGAVWHTGWYDNFYGPVYDGYWGPSGLFYFRTTADDAYHRDLYRHFRRNEFRGGVAFRFEYHGGGSWARR